MSRGNQREQARDKTLKKKAKKVSNEEKLPLEKRKARDSEAMQKKQKDGELKKSDAKPEKKLPKLKKTS